VRAVVDVVAGAVLGAVASVVVGVIAGAGCRAAVHAERAATTRPAAAKALAKLPTAVGGFREPEINDTSPLFIIFPPGNGLNSP
jgi:hypothetical protein